MTLTVIQQRKTQAAQISGSFVVVFDIRSNTLSCIAGSLPTVRHTLCGSMS